MERYSTDHCALATLEAKFMREGGGGSKKKKRNGEEEGGSLDFI